MSRNFKIGDRVWFAYAGGNENQRGYGTVVKISELYEHGRDYGVQKDGEVYEEEKDWYGLWLIEPKDEIRHLTKLDRILE